MLNEKAKCPDVDCNNGKAKEKVNEKVRKKNRKEAGCSNAKC
jgi:hypothetical protein